MFIASYISTKLCLPLTTPDCFIKGETWFTKEVPSKEIKKALLVDDGVGRINGTMQANYDKLKEKFPTVKITKASLYVYKDCVSAVDLYYGFLEDHRLNREEWNLLHRKHGILGTDMDGVLCHDWDPNRYISYEDFLKNAEPYMIPGFVIDYVITNRSVKYYNETKEWLEKYGVKYKVLIMSNGKFDSVYFKSQTLLNYSCDWFWESNYSEALFINKAVGIAVLSFEGMKLLKQTRV